MHDTVVAPEPFDELSRWYGRVGVAVFSMFVAVGLALAVAGRPPLAVAGAALALAAGVPLFLLRRAIPLACAALATAGVCLIASGDPANLGWFALCLVGGWCALRLGLPGGLAYVGAATLLFLAEWFWGVHDPGWGAWTAGVGFTTLAALLVRHQVSLVSQLRALQAGVAERSRLEERVRIARELHDVIAHSLTVSLLHISSARLAVDGDPTQASQSLADAERLTRQSLADVRATVGTIRTEGGGPPAPTPGLGDLPRLVSDLRAAGADVAMSVAGELDGVPATTGATLFRIVQEALTNSTRHAPGAKVTVRISARGGRLELAVDSAGPPGRGRGMGVENMKHRAEAIGGTCSAGPGGSGWLVKVCLPAGPELVSEDRR